MTWSNVPRVFFTKRRLPEVKGINVRLVSFLLQNVALWETSQGEENISFWEPFKLYLNRLLFKKIKPSSLIYGSDLAPLCTSVKLKPNNIEETYFWVPCTPSEALNSYSFMLQRLDKAWSILAAWVYFTCLVVVTGWVQTPRNLWQWNFGHLWRTCSAVLVGADSCRRVCWYSKDFRLHCLISIGHSHCQTLVQGSQYTWCHLRRSLR